jgi:protein-disulfide isomerase
LAVISVLVVAVVIVVFAVRGSRPTASAPSASALSSVPLKPTHILGNSGTNTGSKTVTVVEFLDFECEACGAFYPYVEQLRKDYAGKVTFGFRYFPLPGHGNSRNAAAAVEASSRQGKTEQMYQRMYETQSEWGEKGTDSQAERFRGYAKDLGLDMQRYDRDVASKDVTDLIQHDVDLGTKLGVNSTPTFFINGEPVTLQTYTDLQTAVDAAVRAAR